MKTKNITLILILITTSIFGQVPEKAISIEDKNFNDYFQNNENIPQVKGKILNLSENEIKELKINYSIVTPFEGLQIEKNCKPNIDGTFKLELDYAFPYQQIWISIGKYFYAGIYANTNLFIELDAKKINSQKRLQYNGDGVKYLGTDGKINSYLNNHVLFKRNEQLDISKSLSELKRDRNMNYKKFILKYDSLYSILNELDNEFIKQNPSDYSWLIINDRLSDYYANLCIKHWGKEMPTELFDKIKVHKSYLTSNSGMSFYNYLFTYLSINSNNDKNNYGKYSSYSKLGDSDRLILDSIMLINKSIKHKLSYDTTKYISLIKKANDFLYDTIVVANTLQIMNHLDKLFSSSKSDFLKIKISSKDTKEQKLMTGTVLQNIHTDWCRNIIQKQYNENLEKMLSINKILLDSQPLISGKQLGDPLIILPSGAKLYKVDNMKSETLLANLINSFKNKALVLDFWATWCAPCIQEMPFSKKLLDSTKDLPVEFIYLCTSNNSTVEKWKSKIAEFELGGTHIFVEQDIENELMKLFSANSFPSYVLINTKGDYKPGAITRISHLDKNKLAELIK